MQIHQLGTPFEEVLLCDMCERGIYEGSGTGSVC